LNTPVKQDLLQAEIVTEIGLPGLKQQVLGADVMDGADPEN